MNKILEKIYNIAFDIIEIRLGKKEQVVPFTVVLEKSNPKPTVGMYEPVTDNTPDLLEVIRRDLLEKIEKGEITALCLCYDMNIVHPQTGERTDAISIELADNETGTVNIYVPYNFDDAEIIKKPFQTDSDQKYF